MLPQRAASIFRARLAPGPLLLLVAVYDGLFGFVGRLVENRNGTADHNHDSDH